MFHISVNMYITAIFFSNIKIIYLFNNCVSCKPGANLLRVKKLTG